MMYVAVAFLLCAVWIQSSSSSAIPMWEYLSRGEKVNTPHPPTALHDFPALWSPLVTLDFTHPAAH